MSRELWAVERCPNPECDRELVFDAAREYAAILDFDDIWDRYYVAAGRNRLPGLTYNELRKVIGLEPEEEA